MSVSYLKGDCLEIMKGLPNKSVDCFICDLPYGCLAQKTKMVANPPNSHRPGYSPTERKGCEWDVKIDLDEFWREVKRLRRNDAVPALMFCSTSFGVELINSNPKEFRYDLVWSKSNGVGFLTANKKPMSSHEMIYVFSKKGSYYERIDIEGDYKRNGGGRSSANFLPIGDLPNTSNVDNTGRRCVKSVINIANKKTKGGHPTQKPYELYEWLLKRYCPEGGVVLDPTAGSFTSCIVGKNLGYKAIGIEKDLKFFYKAVGGLIKNS
jgi:site-specific DNA-methyltransferase (adenine-specific)